jgi:hypothetical protein
MTIQHLPDVELGHIYSLVFSSRAELIADLPREASRKDKHGAKNKRQVRK